MLENFFQLGPVPADQMIGTYDIRLVILSYLVATFASYIALDLTARLRDIGNTKYSTLLWLCGGAFAMGAGIWSMHFIGMLAFSMPMMTMTYDPFWTGISMVVAIFASGFALFLLKARMINWEHLALGGIILGLAIASMHYVGMHAMKDVTDIHYLPGLFILSIVIAIIASEAALWLALKSNQVVASIRFRLKFVSAFIMGAAISGMHYTGMAAAIFTPIHHHANLHSTLNPDILAMSIAAVTFFILGIAFFASTYKEAKNQQQLALARQAGMAEVAASVLHNVGNVLNSVNVSAALVTDKILKSKLNELTFLSQLLNDNKNNLNHFFTNDPKGHQLPNYIEKLAEYWKSEQKSIQEETTTLIKNIEHIKNIISMQQNLSKIVTVEQVVSVEQTVEEALFITGIESKNSAITINRNYKTIKPILLDKVKLLQILVNLLQNAKDALKTASNQQSKIIITIDFNSHNRLLISITDNGIGISPGHLSKIFTYGFTTKETGHGFGLHSSALASKEMGGTLSVSSLGEGKGATFTLELPYHLPNK